MFPSFTLFGRQIASYALTAAAGALCMGFYACRAARKRGLDDLAVLVMLLWSAVGAFLGGHLLYALTMPEQLLAFLQSLGRFGNFSAFLQGACQTFGGMVFYGGLLGGIAAAAQYLCLHKPHLPLLPYADPAAPGIPLFHFFGRIGCFLGGCCYGIPCTVGVLFTQSPAPGANGVVRLPVQLIEAAYNLLLFLFLAWLYRSGRQKNRLLNLYFILYPAGRFVLEFFRGDSVRGFFFGLSTSQWISLVLFVCAVCARVYRAAAAIRSRRKATPGG